MNIFKKLILLNKISKKIKAIKMKLEHTHIGDKLKKDVEDIKITVNNLSTDIPEAAGVIKDIIELVSK